MYCVLHDYLTRLFEWSLWTHVPGFILLDVEMEVKGGQKLSRVQSIDCLRTVGKLLRQTRDAQHGESPRGVALETTLLRMITVACEAHQIVQRALIYNSTQYTLSTIYSPTPTYSDASYPSQPHAPFNNSRVLVVGYACSSSNLNNTPRSASCSNRSVNRSPHIPIATNAFTSPGGLC